MKGSSHIYAHTHSPPNPLPSRLPRSIKQSSTCCARVRAKSLQSCPTLCDPMDFGPPRLLGPRDSPRQEHWGGLPCAPPGDLPNTGIEPASLTSLALTGGFFTTSTTWELHTQHGKNNNHTGIVTRMFKTLAWKTTAPLEPGYLTHCWTLFLD